MIRNFKFYLFFLIFFNVYANAQTFEMKLNSHPDSKNYDFIFKNPSLFLGVYKHLLGGDYTYKIISSKAAEVNFISRNIPIMKISYLNHEENSYFYKIYVTPKKIDLLSFEISFEIQIKNNEFIIKGNYPNLPFINDYAIQKVKVMLSGYLNESNQKIIINYLSENNIDKNNYEKMWYEIINRYNNKLIDEKKINNTNKYITLLIYLMLLINIILPTILFRKSFN